jgi:hypothetical protein
MNPQETAQVLRRIAAAIENSKKPQIDQVRRDLELVIQKISGEQTPPTK